MAELFQNDVIPRVTWSDVFKTVTPEYEPPAARAGQPIIAPTIIGGILQGASYRSADSGARFEIFPEEDKNIGCVVYNAAGTVVFKTIVDGTDTGDVIVGDYAGGAGAKWDQSANTFDVKGSITSTSGTIGGWVIVSGYIYCLQSGTPTSSPSDGLVLASGNEGITVYENTEKRVEIGYLSAGVYGIKVYADDGSTVIFEASDTQKVLKAGMLGTGSEISIQGWQHDMAFSATDYRVVAWASGTITLMNGVTYSITGANTGNMSARTYIYLDIGTSTTALQTSTTASDAVGTGKILVAVAVNNADTSSKAEFQTFGAGPGNKTIMVDYIAANVNSTNEFISNSAQIKDAIITNAKIVDCTVDKLTAGTITSKSIVLAVAAGTGDVEIRAGIAAGDFANVGAASGFILGIDDSDSDKAKFFIGNGSIYMKWDGAALSVAGGTITGGTIQTAASGERIVLTSNAMSVYDSSNNRLILIQDFTNGYAIDMDLPDGSEVRGLRITQRDDAVDGLYVVVNNVNSGAQAASFQNVGKAAVVKITPSAQNSQLRFSNEGADPTATGVGAHLIGDVGVVGGILKICTTASTASVAGVFSELVQCNAIAQTISGVKTFGSFPVTPSSAPTTDYQVANKKYVDDTPGNLISVVTTDVTVANTTTETNLISVSIPANTLSTGNAVRATLYISDLDGGTSPANLTFYFKYGTTTIASQIINITSGTGNDVGYVTALLLAAGATNSQEGSFMAEIGDTGRNPTTTIKWTGQGTAAEDSTGALNLIVSVEWGTANAGSTITMSHAVVEKIA